jgi:UDP-N-acetylglucosamine---dolichyl-phosphate N-acetylglucosaminyltransferase
MKVCAVVAAFNEEPTIAAVVGGVRRFVPDVVVVDDGSTDRTAACAAAAGATVVRHADNRGKGAAVRTGLAQALAGPHSHLLLIDGDLQHDPGDIPRLLAAGESAGCDLVLAERAFVKGSMPTARFYSNRIGSWILSRFIGADVADTQCGFRLVRTECLRGVRLTSTGYEIETEMLIALTRRGASLRRVEIAARYDGARSKLRSVRDTVRTCLMAVRFRYLTRPS